MKGNILQIQRMSTEDGPGLRTTVFFKGCGLKCAWCHNPESIEGRHEIQWNETVCILCKLCFGVCSRGALSLSDAGIKVDWERCEGCGTCVGECPSGALELLGRSWDVDELVNEVMKDVSYFGSTGGITASGGEAALQSDFVAAFFRELKSRGINTALDTSGQCRHDSLEAILPYTDLLMYDIKEIDPVRHREFTGSDNKLILENLVRVSNYAEAHMTPREMWIRTPVIPGATDRRENIAGIGAFIADKLAGRVSRWELCAFNNLCRDKYRRMGKDWCFASSKLMSRESMEELFNTARMSGVDPAIVCWSGLTEFEDPSVPRRGHEG